MTPWTDILQHPFVFRLGSTLLHFVWQGAVLGAIAGLLLIALRRGSSQARCATLLVILGLATACPICTFALLGERTEPRTVVEAAELHNPAASTIQSIPTEPTLSEAPASQVVLNAEPPAALALDGRNSEIYEPQARGLQLGRIARNAIPWLVVGWCCGVTLLALRMLGGWWRARTFLTRHVQPLRDAWQPAIERLTETLQVQRAVRCLESTLVSVPITIGWLRPVVVVPTSVLTGLAPDVVECVLAHELAHVRRHDYFVNLLQCAIEVLLFYHPVVWWLSRSIRQEREQVCDELAVSVTGDRFAYSRALLSVADLAIQPTSLAVAADGGELKQRVQKLVGVPDRSVRNSVGPAVTSLALMLGGIAYLLAPSIEADETTSSEERAALHQPPRVEAFGEGKFRLLPISGQVVDAKGQPVAGTQVYLREAARGRTSKKMPAKSNDLALTTTDSGGRFRFTDVPAEEDDLRVDLLVLAEGYALGWKHLPGGVPQENIRIVLKPESRLSGQVVDESGNPVSEATVQLQYVMSIRHITQADLEEGRWPRSDDARYAHLRGFRAPPSAKTDSQGRFTLKGLPPGHGVVLQVVHSRHVLTDAFAATVEEIDPENAASAKRNVQTGELRVSLKQGRLLNVHVVYEDTGAPAVGATYPDILNSIVRPASFEVDQTGHFEIGHLDRREVSLFVYPPVGSDYLAFTKKVTFPENVYEKRHVVKLSRGAVITGNVIDEQTDEGIEGVTLWALSSTSPPGGGHYSNYPFKSQADGSFRVVTLPGSVTLAVHGRVPGYRVSQASGSVRQLASIKQTVTASLEAAVEGIVFKLERAPFVRGTVYDQEGEPAAGVSITGQIPLKSIGHGTAYLPLHGTACLPLKDVTDGKGQFVLNNVHRAWEPDIPPRPVEIVFRDRRRNLGKLVLLDPPAKSDKLERTLDVHLQPLGVVTGRFINADTGQPVPGVRVALYKQDAGPEARIWHSVSPEIRVGRDGRFKLVGAFEGAEHYITVLDGRFQRFNGVDTRFIGEYGERHDLGDLKLVPKEPPADRQLPQIQAPSLEGLSGEEAYDLLVVRYQVDDALYRQQLDEAKSDREQAHILARREPTPVYAEAFRKLVEANRDSDVEFKSLIWILKCRISSGSEKQIRPLKPPAAQRLLEAYVHRKELAECVRVLLIYSSRAKGSKDHGVAAARLLLQKNPHREVQGRTCYEVARQIALRSYEEPSQKAREQAIAYLERVIAEFADIPDWRRGTLGEAAKRDLFELQHLVVGATAPETTGTDADGKRTSLTDFRGKVVVLEFCGSSRGPGILNFSRLNALVQEFGDRVAVVAVISDPPEKAKKTLEEHRVRFRNWVDGSGHEGPIEKLWNVDSWPTIHVLDQQGVIRYKDFNNGSLYDVVWTLLQ